MLDGAPEFIACEQGTEEWFKARLAIPTASEFSTVLAKGKGGGVSKTRQTYLYKLAGEAITGEPMDGFTNAHMERGKEMEAEARDAYAFVAGVDPEPVGFVRRGRAGASPDALIGADGLCEIKTKLPHLLIECHMRGSLPPEHKAQCQGQLWVTGREWLDFVAYWPRMPVFIHREVRDEAYIAALSDAVDAFNAELDEIIAKLEALA